MPMLAHLAFRENPVEGFAAGTGLWDDDEEARWPQLHEPPRARRRPPGRLAVERPGAGAASSGGAGVALPLGREAQASGAPVRVPSSIESTSASVDTGPIQRPVESSGRRRCKCCCACDHKSMSATAEELEKVCKATQRLKLVEDVVVGGELVGKGAKILRIGNRFQRRPHEKDADTLQFGKEALEEASILDMTCRLDFQMARPPLPWCLILKCPSGIFCCTLIFVLIVCAMGITGSVTIDTNFDSFMDSDSDSSLYYNAFLLALEENSDDGRRRLSSADCDDPNAGGSGCNQSPQRPQWTKAAFSNGAASATSGPVRGRSLRELLRGPRGSADAGAGEGQEWWERAGLVLLNDSSNEQPGPGAPQRRLQGNLYKNYEVAVAYMAEDGQVITHSNVARMQRAELAIRHIAQWSSLCDTAEPTMKVLCSPGVAFANVAYATPEEVSPTVTKRHFNGSAAHALPLDIAVKTIVEQGLQLQVFPTSVASATRFEVEGLSCEDQAQEECEPLVADGQCQPYALHETYMQDFCRKSCGLCSSSTAPAGDASDEPATRVEVMRSTFKFQAFCCTTATPNQAQALTDLEDRWAMFVENFVQAMQDEDKAAKDGGLRVFYTGDGVEGHEAMAATMQDLLWAAGSFAFVLFYATLHTRSIFLSSMGLLLVLLSIPSAMSLFFMASGMTSISLMSCLSFFIVIGIGSDMLFVYTDFWKQSLAHSRDRAKRLKFTYAQASISTAATTFTTAMSFLANLASVLRPLREFGFFMGCCVLMAWVIIFVGYPPILVLGERCHRCVRRNIIRRRDSALAATSAVDQLPWTEMRRHPGKVVTRGARQSMWAMAEALDPEKKGVGEVHRQLLGTRFAEFVHRWKRLLLTVFVLLTVVSLISSVASLRQAGGVPEVFPDDHNQVLGKEYFEKFNNFDDAVAWSLWASRDECTDLFANPSCWLYRCETLGRAVGNASNCTCYPEREPDDCLRQSQRRVQLRVMSRSGWPQDVGNADKFLDMMREQYPDAQRVEMVAGTSEQHDCITENWESGHVQVASVLSVPAVDVSFAGFIGSSPACTLKQVCYCGVARCAGSVEGGGAPTGQLLLGDSWLQDAPAAPFGGPARLLATPVAVSQIPPDKIVDVNVVFGLEITGTNPLLGEQAASPYEFRRNFEIQDPWMQRGMYDTCVNLPDDLLVGSTRCWMIGFREYWLAKGKDWPLRPTEDANYEYWFYAMNSKTDGYLTERYFWLSNNMEVLGTYFAFYLTVPNTIGATEALDIKARWDAHFNALDGPLEATWHCSRLWMRAEAQKVIIDSTLVTLGISLGCVFLGVVVFTRSMHLALLVMTVVMSIIICLLFFMTVLMQWPIGAIEVLSLIVFVGFAVDYCLHVAHKYHHCHIHNVEEAEAVAAATAAASHRVATDWGTPSSADDRDRIGSDESLTLSQSGSPAYMAAAARRHSLNVVIDDDPMEETRASAGKSKRMSKLLAQNRSEERFARTRYALERMGSAVVGSAFTTVGCAAFLLPCQLVIFTKIGSVVMAVTIYAIVYTLFPLPSMLMLLGPCGNDFGALRAIAAQFLERTKQGGEHVFMMGHYQNDKHVHYVLHLPTKGIAECEPEFPASRTRIRANG